MPSPPIKDSSPVPKTNSPGSKKSMWPKKVENYLRKSGTKKNPNLTEEKLQEFNRINEVLYEQRSFSSKGKSPYYRGLTESSLALSRQKLSGLSTPGRESDVASNASSSISSFIIKIQELSSCFSPQRVEGKVMQAKDVLSPSGRRRPQHKQIFEQTTLTTLAKEMGLEGKDMSANTTISKDFLLLKKKPLRERDSNTPSPSQVAPKPLQASPKISPTQPQPNEETPSPPHPTNLTPPPPAELPVYTSPRTHSPPSLPPTPVPQYAQQTILSVSLPQRTQTSPQLQPSTPPKPEPKPPSPPPVIPQVEQEVIPPSPTPQTSSQALQL